MILAALLFGLAGIFAVLLVLSLFVPPAATGGTAFASIWPYLLAPAFLFAGLALATFATAVRRPEAWIVRSPWPARAVSGVLSLLGA